MIFELRNSKENRSSEKSNIASNSAGSPDILIEVIRGFPQPFEATIVSFQLISNSSDALRVYLRYRKHHYTTKKKRYLQTTESEHETFCLQLGVPAVRPCEQSNERTKGNHFIR